MVPCRPFSIPYQTPLICIIGKDVHDVKVLLDNSADEFFPAALFSNVYLKKNEEKRFRSFSGSNMHYQASKVLTRCQIVFAKVLKGIDMEERKKWINLASLSYLYHKELCVSLVGARMATWSRWTKQRSCFSVQSLVPMLFCLTNVRSSLFQELPARMDEGAAFCHAVISYGKYTTPCCVPFLGLENLEMVHCKQAWTCGTISAQFELGQWTFCDTWRWKKLPLLWL